MPALTGPTKEDENSKILRWKVVTFFYSKFVAYEEAAAANLSEKKSPREWNSEEQQRIGA